MKTFDTVSLDESDVEPYRNQESVMRLQTQDRCYVGILAGAILEKEQPYLRLRLASYGRVIRPTPIRPDGLLAHIVVDSDMALANSFVKEGQPFRLERPEKIVVEEEGKAKGILLIAFKTGEAVISSRPDDVRGVKSLLAHTGIEPQ